MKMREIKFRAWDKFSEEMIIVTEIDFFNKVITALFRGHLENKYEFDEVELMQFTGLLDKNGKEIYEGDIVRYTSNERIGTRGNYKNSYSVYGDVEITGVVKFGNIEHHHDYKHILAFFVDSNDSISYDSYFYSDSKNRGPQKHTSKLTKPLLLKKEYEVIGNVYEGLLEESK
ncbi:hypothetical protein COD66_23270 [Bacillus cereus]|nr:hypothetical protein COD66_23270 [Bacillus cereus]